MLTKKKINIILVLIFIGRPKHKKSVGQSSTWWGNTKQQNMWLPSLQTEALATSSTYKITWGSLRRTEPNAVWWTYMDAASRPVPRSSCTSWSSCGSCGSCGVGNKMPQRILSLISLSYQTSRVRTSQLSRLLLASENAAASVDLLPDIILWRPSSFLILSQGSSSKSCCSTPFAFPKN